MGEQSVSAMMPKRMSVTSGLLLEAPPLFADGSATAELVVAVLSDLPQPISVAAPSEAAVPRKIRRLMVLM